MGKAPRKRGYTYQNTKIKPEYWDRTYILKRYCLPMKIFREMCILKGIYPKQPPNKGHDPAKVYYSVRDVKFLANDPLMMKYRDFAAFLKKYKSAKGKGMLSKKDSVKSNRPDFTYDHLVKERYPTFQSALGDLDDCLILVFLFSKLHTIDKVSPQFIKDAKQLSDEFCTYVARTRSLRKVFVSIKGFYYQANILGHNVTWVVPFDFNHTIPFDVDFSIFKSFLKFYLTLLRFVNFKMFSDASVPYPLRLKGKIDQTGSHMLSIKEEEDNEEVIMNTEEENEQDSEDEEEKVEYDEKEQRELEESIKQLSSVQSIEQREESAQDDEDKVQQDKILELSKEEQLTDAQTVFMKRYKSMFEGLVFFVYRECPRPSLEFVIKSFGGQVGFHGPDSPFEESSDQITHVIVDRNVSEDKMRKDREYIQPQWVFDCVNARIRLPLEPYKPGKKLPPHLSPFVEYTENTYIPKYAEEIREMIEKEKSALDEKFAANSRLVNDIEKVADEEDEQMEEDEEREAEQNYHMELEAEREGKKFSEFQEKLKKQKLMKKMEKIKSSKNNKKKQKEEEERKLKESVMGGHKLRTYLYIRKGISKTKEKTRVLEERAREIEESENKQE